MLAAKIVPAISPIKIAIERINPVVKILIKRIITIVETAKIKLWIVGLSTLFPILPIATGIRLKPIVVITEPVTIGGNSFRILEKIPETKITKTPATINEPNIAPEPCL